MYELALCAGYGGFSLALKELFGVEHRTVCYVEREAYAAATLVARMEESRLDQAPIWSDLEFFDGYPWRGCVDIVTAGFPCQPFSTAGKGLGTADDRWLWPEIARVVAEVRPRFVFLENVPNLRSKGLGPVLHDLAYLGFDVEWGVLAASAVGAPHERKRLWVVGDAEGSGLAGDGFGAVWTELGGLADAGLADPTGIERTASRENIRRDGGWGGYPPSRGDDDGWRGGWDGPQPAVRRGADGTPVWLADRLHLGGNGLVPQCAAEAWRQLTARFG